MLGGVKPAKRRWQTGDHHPLPGMHPILGRVLSGRGYDSTTAADLSNSPLFHDPFALPDMPQAVITLGVAVREHVPIAVYGDYDADGVTACALLTSALRAGGANVIPYIPNRMTEGYGLHAAALADLAQRGVQCVVTVDCGTSSVDVARTRPPGMHLVITDHHLTPTPHGTEPSLPQVDALVNPKIPGSAYLFDGLAGAGVAWKLVQALEAEGVVPAGSADSTVSLAAMGTIADMMPLRGENRCIVQAGLAALANPSPGMQALAEVSGVRGAVRASDIAFSMAPRINAAGRMENAELALRLCLAENVDAARHIALQLDQQNMTRKEAVTRVLHDAEQRVADIPEDAPAVVLGDPAWPMGVVGLVAGRLAERYACPTFIVSFEGDEGKGSARSVPGLHLVHVLDAVSETLIRYGGHAGAAGLSIEPGRFDEFRHHIHGAVAQQRTNNTRERVFSIDAEVTAADLNSDLYSALTILEPCGQANSQPLLAISNCEVVHTQFLGKDRQHLSIALRDPSAMVEALAFHKPHLQQYLPKGAHVDVCGTMDVDMWDGLPRVRLRLRDVRLSKMDMPVSSSATAPPLAATAGLK